jgi:hypothetical protein
MYLLEQARAHDEKVTDAIVAQNKFRIPGSLEGWTVTHSVLCNFIFVAKQQLDVRIGIQLSDYEAERVLSEDVVVIEQPDPLSSSDTNRRVGCL